MGCALASRDAAICAHDLHGAKEACEGPLLQNGLSHERSHLSIPLLAVPGLGVPAPLATLATFDTLRVPVVRCLLHFTHSLEGPNVEGGGGGGPGGICIGIQDLRRAVIVEPTPMSDCQFVLPFAAS